MGEPYDSQRVIDEAMDEAQAMAPDCTCGATDVEGASHLEWCETTRRERVELSEKENK